MNIDARLKRRSGGFFEFHPKKSNKKSIYKFKNKKLPLFHVFEKAPNYSTEVQNV
jgi:hypothetical protein